MRVALPNFQFLFQELVVLNGNKVLRCNVNVRRNICVKYADSTLERLR